MTIYDTNYHFKIMDMLKLHHEWKVGRSYLISSFCMAKSMYFILYVDKWDNTDSIFYVNTSTKGILKTSGDKPGPGS